MHRRKVQRGRRRRRAPLGLALALLALLVARAAQALTAPEPGAVALPSDLELLLPCAAGEEVFVSAGYGPAAGSSLHFGTDAEDHANDYYALDFILPAYPDRGRGQPVLASSGGTVVKAGWGTEGWANYGQRVLVSSAHGDGHTYVTLYAHLDALNVEEGQEVARGDPIGALGRSCDGDHEQLDCPSFEAHLHWVMHRDSVIGGPGSGGSLAGQAVVPEPLDGYTDLGQGMTLVSRNGAAPTLPCPLIAPELTVLEDDGPCFRRYGSAAGWREVAEGHRDHAAWVTTTAAAEPTRWGIWQLGFTQAYDYELLVYVPPGEGLSRRARYVLRHAGQDSEVVVDQNATPGDWLHLGTFAFDAGGDQELRLADNTGETGPPLGFDDLLVVPSGVLWDPTALAEERGDALALGQGWGCDQRGTAGSAGALGLGAALALIWRRRGPRSWRPGSRHAMLRPNRPRPPTSLRGQT